MKLGMVFNEPDTAPFRQLLRTTGFYTEWQAKFGEAAWTTREGAVGKLA